MINIDYRKTEVYDLAAMALGAWRSVCDAAYAARADLPATVLSVLDSHLATAQAVLFSARTLSTGDALLRSLRAAVEQAGGAPVLSQAEEDAPDTISGTEAGRRIATAADQLAEFLTLAWRIHDELAAEAVITAQRAALENDRTSSVAPVECADSTD